MKKLLLMMFLTSGFTYAQLNFTINQVTARGGEAGGGGDDCENRIQLIADDIKSWIKKGGSNYLKFEGDLNAEAYNTKMLDILNIVSSNELVSNVVECTSDKIYVGETEKTCRWEVSKEVSEQGFKIFCNYDRFMNGVSDESKKLEREDAQYQLVHHEIAGVAGVEGSFKDRSRYNLSNQIVASLAYKKEKKLVVKTGLNVNLRKSPEELSTNLNKVKYLSNENNEEIKGFYFGYCVGGGYKRGVLSQGLSFDLVLWFDDKGEKLLKIYKDYDLSYLAQNSFRMFGRRTHPDGSFIDYRTTTVEYIETFKGMNEQEIINKALSISHASPVLSSRGSLIKDRGDENPSKIEYYSYNSKIYFSILADDPYGSAYYVCEAKQLTEYTLGPSN